MKKIILAAAFLLTAFISFAQSPGYNPPIFTKLHYTWQQIDSALHIPVRNCICMNYSDSVGHDTLPDIFEYDSLPNVFTALYIHAHGQYHKISGSGGVNIDTTSLSNRINAALPIADTSAMLSAYLKLAVANGLFYPLTSNPSNYSILPSVANALQVINLGSANGVQVGVYSARPSAATTHNFFVAIDSLKIYYDNGGWLTISGGSGGGSPQGLQSVLTTGNTLTGNNAVNIGTGTFNWNGTSALIMPGGTTAQRPTAATGDIRFSSDSSTDEIYTGTKWVGLVTTDKLASSGISGTGFPYYSGSSASFVSGSSSQLINAAGGITTNNFFNTIGTFGSGTPDARGASFSGAAIIFQYPNSTGPGMMTYAEKLWADSGVNQLFKDSFYVKNIPTGGSGLPLSYVNGDTTFIKKWIAGTNALFVQNNDSSVTLNINAWGLQGNAGTNSYNYFLGTTDNHGLVFKVSNSLAGYVDSTGGNGNTLFGLIAGNNVYHGTGTANASFGYQARSGSSTTMSNNTDMGYNAGDNDNSSYQVNIGANAGMKSLNASSTDSKNITIGYAANQQNPIGTHNITIGTQARFSDSSYVGSNIAIGDSILLGYNTDIKNSITIGHFLSGMRSNEVLIGGATNFFNLGNSGMNTASIATYDPSPSAGDQYYNTDSAAYVMYNGTKWIKWGGTSTGGGGGGITALTGDVTASGTGSVAATLTTVNSNVGTFGSATVVPVFTVNGKGLITGVTNTNIALTLASSNFANQGTTTTVLHGNASGNPSWGAVSLTTDVSGTLPVANGGTNLSSFTNGGIFYASSSSVMGQVSLPAHAGMRLTSTGTTSYQWNDTTAGGGISSFTSPNGTMNVSGTTNLLADANFSPTGLTGYMGHDSINLDTVGIIQKDTLYNTLFGNYLTALGTSSPSLSGNVIALANTTNNDYNSYVYFKSKLVTYYSQLPKWHYTVYVKITSTPGAATYGIGIGKAFNQIFWLDCSTGANAGKAFLTQVTTNISSTSSALTISANDVLKFDQVYQNDSIYCTVTDVTTSNSLTLNAAFNYVYGQTFNPQGMGNFNVFQKGGAYQILSETIQSGAYQNPPILADGTSKTYGYYAGSSAARYPALLNANYTTTVNVGNPGASTATLLQNLSEKLALHGKTVILEAGCNDIRAAFPSATWQANYISIVNQYIAAGAKVFHICPWENASGGGANLSSLDSFLYANYPTTYIRSVYTSLQSCGSACIAADGVHPNAQGHDSIYLKLVQSGLIDKAKYPTSLAQITADGTGTTSDTSFQIIAAKKGSVQQINNRTFGIAMADGINIGRNFSIGTNDANDVIIQRGGYQMYELGDYPNALTIYGHVQPTRNLIYKTQFDSLGNWIWAQSNFTNITGSANSVVDGNSGLTLSSGSNNTFYGYDAGKIQTTQSRWTAIGANQNAIRCTQCVTVGSYANANVSGSPSRTGLVEIGDGAGYTNNGDSSIYIGMGTGGNTTVWTGTGNIVVGSNQTFHGAASTIHQFNLFSNIYGIWSASPTIAKDTINASLTVMNIPTASTPSADSIMVIENGNLVKASQAQIGISSGTYTPTITLGTNVTACTATGAFYQNVGGKYTVTIWGTLTTTTPATQSLVTFSLPSTATGGTNVNVAGQLASALALVNSTTTTTIQVASTPTGSGSGIFSVIITYY